MAKAVKLPSGSWNIRVYAGKDINGKNIIKSFTAPTRKEAEYKAAQYKMHKKIDPLNTTVEQALNNYIEARSNVLSPATVREYKREAEEIIADIGNVLTKNIDQNILQREINKLSVRLSPHSVRNLYYLLVASLTEAGCDCPSGVNLPQKVKPDIEIPTDEEVETIISYADDPITRTALVLASYCGMRRGEICALRWEDYDGRNITVCRDMVQDENRQWVFKPPKTYAGKRTIPVPDALREELSGLKRTSDRIIPINPNALYNRYNRLLDRIGIKHYSLHALRHYHASVMLSLNIPNGYAAERLGHATDGMLKRVYQHIMQDKKDAFAEKINENLK